MSPTLPTPHAAHPAAHGAAPPAAGRARRAALVAAVVVAGAVLPAGAWARAPAGPPARPQLQPLLPQPVAAALRQAQLPADALAAVVLPATGGRLAGPRWQLQANRPMAPASTMKLVTSIVALDQLGPNLRGSTELWTRAPLLAGVAAGVEAGAGPIPGLAPVDGGVLQGDLILRGGADPELGLPELWALMAELRWQGIQQINGDILLDRHLFNPPRPDLGQPPFDEQPEFPYNVVPDALHLAGSLMDVELRADRSSVQARVLPALPGLVLDTSALQLNDKPCARWDDDWQSPPLVLPETGADGRPVLRVLLRGGFPRACVVRQPLQLIDRDALAERLLRWVWQGLGGQWQGRVREAPPGLLPPPEPLADPLARLQAQRPPQPPAGAAGPAPTPQPARVPGAGAGAGAAPAASAALGATDLLPPRLLARRQSRPWGELLRTLNKRSDNAFSRLLYLQLGVNAMAGAPGVPTQALAAQAVRAWLAAHRIPADGLVLDNGSGLSRSARIAPATLAAMLREAQRGRWASELQMSLPLVGIDGTMRNRLRASPAGGWARMKTGTLRDTTALAGYVPDPQGRLWVVVAMLNHPQAAAGRPALDALVDWVARGGMTATRGDDALVLPVEP